MDGLQEELKKSKKQGYMSEDFALIALQIANKIIYQKKYKHIKLEAKEEAISIFSEKLCKNWQKLNPESSIMSYISQIANNTLINLFKSHDNNKRKLESYKEHLINSEQKTFEKKILIRYNINISELPHTKRSAIFFEILKQYKLGHDVYYISELIGIDKVIVNNLIQLYNKIGYNAVYKVQL